MRSSLPTAVMNGWCVPPFKRDGTYQELVALQLRSAAMIFNLRITCALERVLRGLFRSRIDRLAALAAMLVSEAWTTPSNGW